MDGHKREGVSDEALEREIETALGVDPSPEFLPRVRARVAREYVQEGWFSSALWRWAGAAAVVTAVAIIGVLTLRDPAPAPREVRITPPVETAAPVVEPARLEPDPVASARAPKAVRVRAVRPFEVVISPDDAAALRQLVAALTARQVEATDIPALGAESAPLPALEEIVVAPINISPLAALEGE